MMYFTDYWLQR